MYIQPHTNISLAPQIPFKLENEKKYIGMEKRQIGMRYESLSEQCLQVNDVIPILLLACTVVLVGLVLKDLLGDTMMWQGGL